MRYLKMCILKVGLLFSGVVAAQDWHPGKPGEDAPGGKAVGIALGDLTMHGVLYYPPNFDSKSSQKLPAVIMLHGWSPYGTRAGEPYTYAAKEYAEDGGVVALAITMRGWPETGGKDDCGLTQPSDIIKAARWLAKQPGVDPAKIVLRGQSLGGQVALSAAALDSIIAATVAYFPITDFRLWGVTTALHHSVLDDYIYGMCAENGTPEDRSPLYSAHNIKGPVLLLHGDQDNNVIVAHSKLMYQKMREANQNVTLKVMEGGGHGSGGDAWKNHNRIVFDFLHQNFNIKKTAIQ